ncbi:MAG: hypothetical protein P8J32_05555 [bacterium]|nr:hypothetical protein [bacterium]
MKRYTLEEAQALVNKIDFAPSGIQMHETGKPKFEIEAKEDMFVIRCSFWRPDTLTGEMGTGFGRWYTCPLDVSEKGLIMTAWLAFEQIVKHEMMECFLYEGARLFNPHKTLEQLAYPEVLPGKRPGRIKRVLRELLS